MNWNIFRMNVNIRSDCVFCLPSTLPYLPVSSLFNSSILFSRLAAFLPFFINRQFVETSSAFAPLIESLRQYSQFAPLVLISTVHIPFANNQQFCKLNLPNDSRKNLRTFHQSSAHFHLLQFFFVHLFLWCMHPRDVVHSDCHSTHTTNFIVIVIMCLLMICLCSLNFSRVSNLSAHTNGI